MGNEFKDLFGDWEPGEDNSSLGDDAPDGEFENRVPRYLDEKEVKVIGVYEAPAANLGGTSQTFVMLQDALGRKVLIVIGRSEAIAISMALDGEDPERPLTHDLLKLTIGKLGGTLERIIIDDIWQETFYAKLAIQQGTKTIEIDCRPSDALALSLRVGAPIFMAEDVIVQCKQDS